MAVYKIIYNHPDFPFDTDITNLCFDVSDIVIGGYEKDYSIIYPPFTFNYLYGGIGLQAGGNIYVEKDNQVLFNGVVTDIKPYNVKDYNKVTVANKLSVLKNYKIDYGSLTGTLLNNAGSLDYVSIDNYNRANIKLNFVLKELFKKAGLSLTINVNETTIETITKGEITTSPKFKNLVFDYYGFIGLNQYGLPTTIGTAEENEQNKISQNQNKPLYFDLINEVCKRLCFSLSIDTTRRDGYLLNNLHSTEISPSISNVYDLNSPIIEQGLEAQFGYSLDLYHNKRTIFPPSPYFDPFDYFNSPDYFFLKLEETTESLMSGDSSYVDSIMPNFLLLVRQNDYTTNVYNWDIHVTPNRLFKRTLELLNNKIQIKEIETNDNNIYFDIMETRLRIEERKVILRQLL